MNAEQQRIAIAEACGFINVRMWSESCIASMGVSDEGKYWGSLGVPDYFNDLNAMHEAETVMTDQQRTSYLDKLYEVCNPHSMLNDDWNLTCATAAQRAEAFVKTIGKWEGDNQ